MRTPLPLRQQGIALQIIADHGSEGVRIGVTAPYSVSRASVGDLSVAAVYSSHIVG
jgi:hypothetical protein